MIHILMVPPSHVKQRQSAELRLDVKAKVRFLKRLEDTGAD
jgi:hypothetical protein